LRVIAEKEGIPFDYLEKVFSMLEKGGLVSSRRGVLGGYYLSRSPREITLKDIFEALGEPVYVVGCVENNCPRNKSCHAFKAWERVNKEVERSLSSVKLSEL